MLRWEGKALVCGWVWGFVAPVQVLGSDEDVLLDWADVFPSPVVSLALGLDVVALLGRDSVDDGARGVSALICPRQEHYFLARV